jgi:superfamily II DNA or RNA helicase
MKHSELRPHQQKAASLLRAEWKTNRTHLISASVAFGKTALASYIIGSHVERGMKCLFIAPYTVLVEQTAKRFREYGLPEAGIIWQNHPDYAPHRLIQIASADTLIRREWPSDIDLIIVDECHIRRAKLLEIIRDTDKPVIGLSGTPFSPWLGEYYQSFIKPCSMRELIDQGYLSDYEFFAPTKPNLQGVKSRTTAGFGVDYVDAEVAEIMGDAVLVGDICNNWLENGQNRATIAFCCNVGHANVVTNRFNIMGVTAEVMTAKTKKEERDIIVRNFEQGITKVICNVGVLVAGFDSDVRCIIYARPTKSEIRWIQCIGRGLRTAKGKDKCLVFDHSGTVHRLGFPDQIEYDELPSKNDGLKEQERLKKEIERLEKVPKPCGKCSYMKPAGVYMCPKCGHKPLGGDDVDTDVTRKLESLSAKLEVPVTMQDKQKFYSELCGYQRERAAKGKPISDGYIAHKYKAKFGVWPKGLDKSARVPSPETRNWLTSQNIRYAKSRVKPSPQNTAAGTATLNDLRELLN